MKKLFATIVCAAFAVIAFAQSGNMYKMTTTQDADRVLKVLSTELKLEGTTFDKVREILLKSAENQAQMATRKENLTPDVETAIVNRQTAHIENNFKTVLSETQYQAYMASKDKIQVAVSKLKGN